jgi:hypothetical protein
MDISGLLKLIEGKVRDPAQLERIRDLATRVGAAFDKGRGPAVKIELERDWNQMKIQFEIATKKVQQETGLY